MLAGDRPLFIAMPPKRRVAAQKRRWANARKELAEAEPAVEPVELEEESEESEDESEDESEEYQCESLLLALEKNHEKTLRGIQSLILDPAERRSFALVHLPEKTEADEAAWEEENWLLLEDNRLLLLQRAEDHRLAELWRARELAEPVCVCVCGKCWKGGVSPLASQFGSLSVATVNAMV